MNAKVIIKILCLTVIGAPPLLAATQGLVIPPAASAIVALLALLAGYTLAELQPGFTPSRMADQIMSQSQEQRSELLTEIERRTRGRVAAHSEIARQAAGVREQMTGDQR